MHQRALCAFFIFLIAGSMMGCAGNQSSLTLRSDDGSQIFEQTFDRAYSSKTSDGSYRFILLNEAAANATKKSDSGRPLEPSNQPPLRQVVYVKVLWRPMSGTRDSMIANAAIDWYVMNNTSGGSEDLLLYQGAGYVTLKDDNNVTQVTIKSANLRPTVVRGDLKDPVGAPRVRGSFVAVKNDERFNEVLSSTRSRTAALAAGR